jgi:hypothetical protein
MSDSNFSWNNACIDSDDNAARIHAIKSFKVLEGSTAATIAAKWFEAGSIDSVSEDKHDEPHLMGRPSKKSKVASNAALPLPAQAPAQTQAQAPPQSPPRA